MEYSETNYSTKLNLEHSLRMTRGVKGTRQKVIIMHNPSEIDKNQLLLVRFLNLGSDNIIIPGKANLSFNIKLSSMADKNRTLVSNVGRAIVKKLAVKFEGNEMLGVENFNVFACYGDLWMTELEKRNTMRQVIIHSSNCTENCIKKQINAGNKGCPCIWDTAIANGHRKKLSLLSTLKCWTV